MHATRAPVPLFVHFVFGGGWRRGMREAEARICPFGAGGLHGSWGEGWLRSVSRFVTMANTLPAVNMHAFIVHVHTVGFSKRAMFSTSAPLLHEPPSMLCPAALFLVPPSLQSHSRPAKASARPVRRTAVARARSLSQARPLPLTVHGLRTTAHARAPAPGAWTLTAPRL